MANKMKVLKGAGVSADTLEIIVTKGEEVLYQRKFYYGYDLSWKKEFAICSIKPYDKDLIEQIAKQYGVEEVEYGEGVRLNARVIEAFEYQLYGSYYCCRCGEPLFKCVSIRETEDEDGHSWRSFCKNDYEELKASGMTDEEIYDSFETNRIVTAK